MACEMRGILMRPDLLMSVQGLSVSFWEEKRRLQALKEVSFDIPKSKTVCLVGESGCGKSVTARTLLGITGANSKIDQGTIHYTCLLYTSDAADD